MFFLQLVFVFVWQIPSVKRVIDPYELGEEDTKDIAGCITAGRYIDVALTHDHEIGAGDPRVSHWQLSWTCFIPFYANLCARHHIAFPSVTDKENTAVNSTTKSVVASSLSHSPYKEMPEDEVQCNIISQCNTTYVGGNEKSTTIPSIARWLVVLTDTYLNRRKMSFQICGPKLTCQYQGFMEGVWWLTMAKR